MNQSAKHHAALSRTQRFGRIPAMNPQPSTPEPDARIAAPKPSSIEAEVAKFVGQTLSDAVDDQSARIAELELALATIGDLAVADWDNETVGKVDALVKDPIRYRDQLRALFGAHKKVAELERELSKYRGPAINPPCPVCPSSTPDQVIFSPVYGGNRHFYCKRCEQSFAGAFTYGPSELERRVQESDAEVERLTKERDDTNELISKIVTAHQAGTTDLSPLMNRLKPCAIPMALALIGKELADSKLTFQDCYRDIASKAATIFELRETVDSLRATLAQVTQERQHIEIALGESTPMTDGLNIPIPLERRVYNLAQQLIQVTQERDEARADADVRTGQLQFHRSVTDKLTQERDSLRAQVAASEADRARSLIIARALAAAVVDDQPGPGEGLCSTTEDIEAYDAWIGRRVQAVKDSEELVRILERTGDDAIQPPQ